MWGRFLSRLWGSLWVFVRGRDPEGFINRAVLEGGSFWDIRSYKQGFLVRMPVDRFRGLRGIARDAGCRLHIEKRLGLPFFLKRVRRRPALAVVPFLLLAVLYVLTSFIWFVEVVGTDKVPEEEVVQAAASLGLVPGILKGDFDSERVANRLPLLVEELSWAGVEVIGTRAVIEVAEKTLLEEEDSPNATPAHLVAEKTGLLSHVLVQQGTALVQEGETVQKGQLLVTGFLPGEVLPQEEREERRVRLVRSKGELWARVWYEGYAEVALTREIRVPTGEVTTRRVMKLLGREILATGGDRSPYADYRLERTRWLTPEWRNSRLPVEVEVLQYHEMVQQQERLSREEAIGLAREQARRDLLDRIPIDAIIRDINFRVVQETPGLVGITMVVEAEEDIGELRPIPGWESGGTSGQ